MTTIKKHLYSKKGLVLSSIARDCIMSDVGDKLPTIKDYTTAFFASRGIVQESIKQLQEAGAINIKTGGVKGTILTKINKKLLISYTGWRAITVSLPLPLNPLFASLTTALKISLKNLPLEAAFAHTSGANKRLQLLLSEAFDIIIVSKKSAEVFLDETNLLNPPTIFENAGYSYPFYLYSKHKDGVLRDGMTTLIDSSSTDQSRLVSEIFKNYKINHKETPYVTILEPQNFLTADAVVVRAEDSVSFYLENGYYQHDISNYTNYSMNEYLQPVLLTNKENYGIDRLVKKYFDESKIGDIQRKVLLGEIKPLL